MRERERDRKRGVGERKADRKHTKKKEEREKKLHCIVRALKLNNKRE